MPTIYLDKVSLKDESMSPRREWPIGMLVASLANANANKFNANTSLSMLIANR